MAKLRLRRGRTLGERVVRVVVLASAAGLALMELKAVWPEAHRYLRMRSM
jgi:hypothetical protein